jgi:hypothetical protein
VRTVTWFVVVVLAVIGAGVGIVGAVDHVPTTGTVSGTLIVSPSTPVAGTLYLFPASMRQALCLEGCWVAYGPPGPMPPTLSNLAKEKGVVSVGVPSDGVISADVATGTYYAFATGPEPLTAGMTCSGGTVDVRQGATVEIKVVCRGLSVPVSQLGNNGGGYTFGGTVVGNTP